MSKGSKASTVLYASPNAPRHMATASVADIDAFVPERSKVDRRSIGGGSIVSFANGY